MPLNYTSYIDQTANLMVIGSTDANFLIMKDGMIDYAEQRIYRELDLLYTQVTDSTSTVTANSRSFTLPTTTGNPYIIVDNFNIITPAGITASAGTRVQLTPTSREFLDIAYPSGQTATGTPEFFAMASNTEVILGPAPDAAYVAEVIGVQRPSPLTVTNSSTILTQYVPDLFIAASMVYAAGWQRDYSAQGDNPQQGASWESQYQKLLQSASVEQARAKFQSEGWTSDQPSAIATPKRV